MRYARTAPALGLPRFLLLVLLLSFLVGIQGTRAQDSLLVPHQFYNHETTTTVGGTPVVAVRVVLEFQHAPGASSTYFAWGWGPQVQGRRGWTLSPARREAPPSDLFPEATVAEDGNLVYIFLEGTAPANRPDLVEQLRNRIETRFRATTFPWEVYAQGFGRFHTFVRFDPDTVAVSDTFKAHIIGMNRLFNNSLENVEPIAPLAITSADGGAARIESGPVPSDIPEIPYPAQDTLTYTLVAEKPGTLDFRASLQGLYRRFYDDLIPSRSICGEFASLTCQMVITGNLVVVNSTGDAPRGKDDEGNPLEGCDTGETIERDGLEVTECTLRAAIEAANAEAEDEASIHFNIPDDDAGCSSNFGCAIIVQETALPSLERTIAIDATTQPGYAVENPDQAPLITVAGDGGVGAGLRLLSDNCEIKGLQINAFAGSGIEIQGSGAKVIRSNVSNNGVGVLITSGDGNEIGEEEAGENGEESFCWPNIIGGNSEAGIKIEEVSSSNVIQCNVIGHLPDVRVSGPNGVGLLIEDAPSNYVNKNLIAGNIGVGLHIVGAGATGNLLKANRIGGFPELGTEGNAWGVVIESASNNSLGSQLVSGRSDYNVISGNSIGNVLIFSEDPQAPADNNTVQHSGIGTDQMLHTTVENGRYGLVISGSASNNTIGPYTEDQYSMIIGPHREADLAVYTPEAVGNKILSGLIGVGMELLEGGSTKGGGAINIDVRGAIDTHIGSFSPSASLPSIVTGNAGATAILVEGTDERRVTLEGVDVRIREKTGTGTKIQGINIGGLGTSGFSGSPVGRNGIILSDTRGVHIGPLVDIAVCINSGISVGLSDENTIVGTQLHLGDHSGCRFDDTAGITLVGSSRNIIGSLDPSGESNTFDGLPVGIYLGREHFTKTQSAGNQIVGNTFGAQERTEVGISLWRGVSYTEIGDNAEGGNRFFANDIAILLNGSTDSNELLNRTVIEGNTFEGLALERGGTAIEVQQAFNTRIGGTTQSGSTGGNTIFNYRHGVVLQRPAESDDGTVILGNSIYDTEEHGIIGWGSLLDRIQDPFRLPLANIFTTETSLSGSSIRAKGSAAAPPDRLMLIQFIRSGACTGTNEGKHYLGQETVQTNAMGRASFSKVVDIEEGDGLTVTATDVTSKRTSEFSLCYTHGAADQTSEVAFDAGTGDTIVDENGVIGRVASVGKAAIAGTLYITAYPDAPLGNRFTGEAARAPSGQSMLPRSATGRYWRIETAEPVDGFTLDLCLDASDLSDSEAMEAVLVQRSQASAGRWVPHETHLETHDDTPYACTNGIVPTGEFGFGNGTEAVLAAPVLTLPENDATNVDPGTALSWQDVPDAASYDLQVALDAGFTTLLTDMTGLPSATVSPDSLARSQVHHWRVRGVTAAGEAGPWSPPFRFAIGATGVSVEEEAGVPEGFALEPNYPNPFNPQTTIGFALAHTADVRLVVYDVLGREVARLVEGTRPAGHHRVVFDAAGLPTGVYLYRLQAGPFAQTRRMLLVK